jgi:hypothetical protein
MTERSAPYVGRSLRRCEDLKFLTGRAQTQYLIRLPHCRGVIAAANLVDGRDVVRNVLVELRRALGNGASSSITAGSAS